MQENRRIKIFFFLCGGVFLFHFIMVGLHNLPEEHITPRMESYSHLWSYPVFHQGWALFAPEPQNRHKRMEMRYHTLGNWTEWYRAESICIDEHRRYRVTHFSKLCHVTQNTVYYLWMDVDRFNEQELPADEFYSQAMGYGIAYHFAQEFVYHFLDAPAVDSLEIRLILEDPYAPASAEVVSFPVKAISAHE